MNGPVFTEPDDDDPRPTDRTAAREKRADARAAAARARQLAAELAEAGLTLRDLRGS